MAPAAVEIAAAEEQQHAEVVSPSAATPARDAMLEQYGVEVLRNHQNSIWRRDLVYQKQGLRLEIRPMTPDDDAREADFLNTMTMRERIMRFMGARRYFPPEMIHQLTHIDYDRDFAIVAADRATDRLIGIARYCRDPKDMGKAEVAVAVLQQYQRLGLARYLMAAVFDSAREAGIRTLVAEILRENSASRQLMEKVGKAAGTTSVVAAVEPESLTIHYLYDEKACPDAVFHEAAEEHQALPAQPQFQVDDSRHPRSLWRHDLVFPSGLRVEVRPGDVDDKVRVEQFAADSANDPSMPLGTQHDLFNYTSGFTLVAIDMSSDKMIGVAHFKRAADWSRLSVVTSPSYRGLGIADFLSTEVLRAAGSVLPSGKSNL